VTTGEFSVHIQAVDAGRQVQVEWLAIQGVEYELQTSHDLIDWTAATTVHGEDRETIVADTLRCPATFYRVRTTPAADEVIRRCAARACTYFHEILCADSTGGGALPRNEASREELETRSFTSDFFVPGELGEWLAVAVMGHAMRTRDPSFVEGWTDAQFSTEVASVCDALEKILTSQAYGHPVGGKKALYQVHLVPGGEAPRTSEFERIVSLLDNGPLMACLDLTAAYIRSTPSLDSSLAARIDALSAQFDVRMWFSPGSGALHIGEPENPAGGPVMDRIVSEGRLAAVTGLARGELSEEEFSRIIHFMLASSYGDGTHHQFLPFAGTGLEIWSPLPFLPEERCTYFGLSALRPLSISWSAARSRLGARAAGATGISDGFGNFRVFSLDPAEQTDPSPYRNARVLIFPAIIAHGAGMGTEEARLNLVLAYDTACRAGAFHPKFGLPNYLDCGSGLVNSASPAWGTREVGAMTVAMLNYLLGGRFIENTLRSSIGWAHAFDAYFSLLDNVTVEAEGPTAASGGAPIVRNHASGQAAWHLDAGQAARYDMSLVEAGIFDLSLRYSNDDVGNGDAITITVGAAPAIHLQTEDTGDDGSGWDVFFETVPLHLGPLPEGVNPIEVAVETSDGYGIDLDRLSLSFVGHLVSEAEDRPSGGAGVVIDRGNASQKMALHLQSGEQAELLFEVTDPGNYALVARYSNDDIGVGEPVAVLVDGQAVGTFHADDTGDLGNGWNRFFESGHIALGHLEAGQRKLTLLVGPGDGYGLELDRCALRKCPR